MLFTDLENENINDEALAFNTSWDPEEGSNSDWEDEDDEDLEDEDFEDRAEDLDDLHEPDPEDDDHFPEDDE